MNLFGVTQETERLAKIKRFFQFFFWGSFVPIAAISAIIYFSGHAILQKQAIDSIAALNEAKTAQLNLFIEKLKVRTADWSSDGKIRKDAELITQGKPLSSDLSLYLRDEKLPIDLTAALVDVLDINGIVIASSDILRLGEDEGQEHISFFEARRASFGETIFTPGLLAEEDELVGVPMLHFAAPLISVETGKTVGVLLLHVKNDELNRVLAISEGETLEAYLVNREKLMITPSRFIPNAVLTQSVDTLPVRVCFDRGKDYQGSHLNYQGESVFGVSKCLPEGLGVIITEIHASEAFASITVFRNVAALAIVIILVLVLIYAYFSGRKLLPQTITTTTTTTTTTIILVITIIIGVSFSLFLSRTLETFVRRIRTEPIFDLVQGQAGRHITDAKYFSDWQNGESRQRLGDFVSELKASLPPVAAVNIYNADAILIWSDVAIYKEVIGKKHEEEDVRETFRKGQLIKSADAEIQRQIGSTNLLAIYTPIFLEDGAVLAGIAEVYFDISDLSAFIRRMHFFIWGLISMALATIYLLLHIAFRKQNEQIIRQAKELESYAKGLESMVSQRTAQLAEEKDKLQTTLESIGDGAFSIDASGNIVFFNKVAEEISGYAASEVIGKHYRSALRFVLEKDDSENYKFIEDVFARGVISRISNHTVLLTKDGHRVPVEDSAAPLKDAYGKVIGAVVIFRDVTAARELEKTEVNFISIASHQLRTPLSAIRWIAEMFLGGDLGTFTEDQRRFLGDIYKSTRRLLDLVNILLASSRVEESRVDIKPVPIDMIALTKEVVAGLESLTKAKNLQLTVIAQPLPKINLALEMFRQVVLNLVSNAINYTPDGGRIAVRFELKPDAVICSVQDTGIGIPKKDQRRIFEKFFRADNAIAAVADGSGLGLSLAKAIVLMWNGEIWFASEEGKGTTFFFTIPLAGMKSKSGEVKMNA